MDWSSIISTLIGSIVGAFTIYFTFKNRITSFQESIHTKQIDAIIVIFDKIKFPFFVAILIGVYSATEKEEELEVQLEVFQNQIENLFSEYIAFTKNDLVLPQKVFDCKKRIVSDIIELVTSHKELSRDAKINLVHKISKERANLIKKSRELIGVDELSKLNIDMFSSSQITNKTLAKLNKSSIESLLKKYA